MIVQIPTILAWCVCLMGPVAASERIDAVLSALQNRSDGLTDIQCRVRFVEEDQINLTKRTKVGSIRFLMTEPNPQFLIHFERTETDGVVGKQEWYLFDGRRLHQAVERIKQVTVQNLGEEGEKLDLFDLDRTPFPLPFGQKKDVILRSFDVTLVAPDPTDPPNTDHLFCIPKPGSRMHQRYDKLEFFVDKEFHLPVRIVVTKNEGLEVNTAEFPGLGAGSINSGLTPKDFARPSPWRDFTEVRE